MTAPIDVQIVRDGAPMPSAAPGELPATAWGGYRLTSNYQPIYSLTHHRVVGHEALLRASRVGDGAPVAPLAVFAGCADDDEALLRLDRLALMQHLRSYAGGHPSQWLFLNVHPRSLASPLGPSVRAIGRALAGHGLRPGQVVVEVLESALPEDAGFEQRIEQIRALGCLVCLDDFGAGHSNFDRVFRLRPEIVKLDRSVVVRAEVDPHARRIAQQMVSLLHECGCLVLMEGIETAEGAYTALRCDVDFVQGYHFSRPATTLAVARAGKAALQAVWDRFDLLSTTDDHIWQEKMGPYKQAIELASVLLAGGAPMAEACRRFLSQPGADMCFLLDKRGRQVGPNVYPENPTNPALESIARFEPVHDTHDARWSRRPYFRSAARSPNIAQVTQPYMRLQGSGMCFTVSIQFECRGQTMVLCGDASQI